MSPITITLISCFVLTLLPHTSAAYGPLNYSCCVKYTRIPLPFGVIRGYIVQSSREVCRIDAIVFLTKGKNKVCASPTDEWVKTALARLRSKVNKLVHRPTAVGTSSAIPNTTSIP